MFSIDAEKQITQRSRMSAIGIHDGEDLAGEEEKIDDAGHANDIYQQMNRTFPQVIATEMMN